MTVRELLKALSRFSPDEEVTLSYDPNECKPGSEVQYLDSNLHSVAICGKSEL